MNNKNENSPIPLASLSVLWWFINGLFVNKGNTILALDDEGTCVGSNDFFLPP